MPRKRGERGAVAVEFAIIAPLLILVTLVMVDFGRVMFVQLSLNSSAKEAVRALALGPLPATPTTPVETTSQLVTRVVTLARASSNGAANIAQMESASTPAWVCGNATFTRTGEITLANCPAPVNCTVRGSTVPLTVATRFNWITPGFASFNASSRAVSLCVAL